MTNQDLAIQFIKYFSEGDIKNLKSLLSEDFYLKGPLFEFHSSNDYIESLSGNLEKADYKIYSINEDRDIVTIEYDYIKSSETIRIKQQFYFSDNKIIKTTLEF